MPDILFFNSTPAGLKPAPRPKQLDNFFLSAEMQKTQFRLDKPLYQNSLDKGTDNSPLFNQQREDKQQLNLIGE